MARLTCATVAGSEGLGRILALIVWWGSWRSSPGTPAPCTQLWCWPPAGSLERGSWSGLGLHGTDLLGIQEQLWWGYLVHEFMVMFEAAHLAKNPDFGWARRQNCVVGHDRVLLLM